MMVLGIFTSVTYSNQFIAMIQGAIGPILLLLGAFIVWLESDEWRMQREEKSESQSSEIRGQQTLQQETESTQDSDVEKETREAAREIKQAVSGNSTEENRDAYQLVSESTVREVKEELADRDDLSAQEVLKAEKNNQNRKTLIDYLERQI